MRKPNIPIAIMSTIISVMLWLNVTYSRDRSDGTQVLPIKLDLANLDKSKFVASNTVDTISVTIVGNSDQISEVTKLKTIAYVDLSGAVPGTRTYPVQIFPSKVREFMVNTVLTAQIRIENLSSKRIDIVPKFMGSAARNIDVSQVDIFPKSIYVIGPSDAIQKTTKAVVGIDSYGEIGGQDIAVVAVDAAGNPIPRVYLSFSDQKPIYDEENIAKAFLVRVRVSPKPAPVKGTIPIKP
jgi:YbbR domain-containing protein